MLKRLFESYLLLSRWLLAPFLAILTLALFALMVKAGKKALTLATLIMEGQDQHVTLAILNLIDITLIGALVVIVTISVYENFVARISPQDHGDWPEWIGSIDFSQLKLKLMATIVAITAIELLEAFIDADETTDRDLYFAIGIHLTFVFSTLALAVAERLSGHETRGGASPKS
ncbi:MAG: YqhA family protein [Methylocystis sp.]